MNALLHYIYKRQLRSMVLVVLFGLAHPTWALDLNQANAAELDGLKGMGPALSRKVLAARAVKPFDSWLDFRQRVSGMGPAKAKQFSDQGLTIQGRGYEP